MPAQIAPHSEPEPTLDPTAARGLRAILEFTEFVAAQARSAGQRERVARAAGEPVTGANLGVLRLVARHGPIVVRDVAHRLGVDQSTASRQLRPLEELGLVARTTDDRDRRVAWLTATPEGRDVLARVDEVIMNDFAVAMSDWSPAERETFTALLDRFRVALRHTRTDPSGWSVAKAEERARSAEPIRRERGPSGPSPQATRADNEGVPTS